MRSLIIHVIGKKMPDFTTEQLEQIRFCLDNWCRIEYLKSKKVFDFANGSITLNYKPDGSIQSVKYYEVDNESELSTKLKQNQLDRCDTLILTS